MRTVAGLLVCAFGLTAQIPEDNWRFVHARAGFIVGIEWAKIANSEFVRQLKHDFDGQTKTIRSEVDFIDEFESALISAPVPAAPQASNEGLIVLRGRFDLTKLRQAARAQNARKQDYDGIEMYTAAKVSVAILSNRLVLIGDRASVASALRDRDRVTPPSNDLIVRARGMAANAHVFVVADSGTAQMKGMRSISLAIAVRARAELTATVEAADEASAAALVASMPTQAVPLKVTVTGNTVKVAGSVGPPEIRAAAQQFGQTLLARLAGVPPGMHPIARPLQPVEAPLPPEKQVVKIYGLEEGVREIKLSPR